MLSIWYLVNLLGLRFLSGGNASKSDSFLLDSCLGFLVKILKSLSLLFFFSHF